MALKALGSQHTQSIQRNPVSSVLNVKDSFVNECSLWWSRNLLNTMPGMPNFHSHYHYLTLLQPFFFFFLIYDKDIQCHLLEEASKAVSWYFQHYSSFVNPLIAWLSALKNHWPRDCQSTAWQSAKRFDFDPTEHSGRCSASSMQVIFTGD